MSNLIDISFNLGSYLSSLSPQVKDGSLQYYISGSLATMIMASAENITEINLDESNNIVGERPSIAITEEQREKIAKFSRRLGFDIDVVNVNGGLFHGAPNDNKPHAQNVIQHVPQVLELMSWSPRMAGSMYIDSLEGDRDITYHPVVRVEAQNRDFYVTAPPEQFAHKLAETIWLSNRMSSDKFSDEQKDKYEKDIKDLSSMFYGFKDLYEKEEFLSRVFFALENKKESLFSTRNPMFNCENSMKAHEVISRSIMERIVSDSSDYLENIADDQSSTEIKDFFTKLLAKRKMEVEKIINSKKTPLQEREDER